LDGLGREFYLLGLMDLFGLVTVEQNCPQFLPWVPRAVRRTTFGDAVLVLICFRRGTYLHQLCNEGRNGPEEEESPEVEALGAWQPLFQPYFPEWRRNLELPKLEERQGTFVFRVSVADVWRRIAMPADATLDELVSVILESVRFDDDHLYQFSYRDHRGADVAVCHPAMERGLSTSDVRIGTLPLALGDSIELWYDFGDDWIFTVKLEWIEPPGRKIKAPRVMERHGRSPAQYSHW
jgi:hypothetical protein